MIELSLEELDEGAEGIADKAVTGMPSSYLEAAKQLCIPFFDEE